MIQYIYALVDPYTDVIRYIGKSKNPEIRLKDHLRQKHRYNTHKNAWLISLGVSPKLVILGEYSEEEVNNAERYWISQYNNLTNLTEGGEGVSPQPLEVRVKISESLRGKPSWNAGLTLSDTHRKALSEAHKGKKQTPETIEKRVSKLRGIPRTLDVKAKISATKREILKC